MSLKIVMLYLTCFGDRKLENFKGCNTINIEHLLQSCAQMEFCKYFLYLYFLSDSAWMSYIARKMQIHRNNVNKGVGGKIFRRGPMEKKQK